MGTNIGVLQSAGFLVEGFQRSKLADKANEAWGCGYLELISELVKHADYAHEVCEAGYKQHGSMPGVFDYEVSEEVGRMFAEYVADGGIIPDDDMVRRWIDEKAQDFFDRWQDDAPKAKFKVSQTVYTKIDKKLRQADVVEVHTIEGLAIGKPTFKYVVSSDTPAGFNERYEVWEHSVFATPNEAFGL